MGNGGCGQSMAAALCHSFLFTLFPYSNVDAARFLFCHGLWRSCWITPNLGPGSPPFHLPLLLGPIGMFLTLFPLLPQSILPFCPHTFPEVYSTGFQTQHFSIGSAPFQRGKIKIKKGCTLIIFSARSSVSVRLLFVGPTLDISKLRHEQCATHFHLWSPMQAELRSWITGEENYWEGEMCILLQMTGVLELLLLQKPLMSESYK